MEILQLQYFCEAAKHQNFSRAAEKFQVPVSGISFSVKRLEQELGKQLFVRSANKIRLTAEGRAYFESTRRALELLDNAKSRIHEEEDVVHGTIKLAVLVNHRLISKMIDEFKGEYPNVNFIITHRTGAKASENDMMISDELLYFPSCSKKVLLTEELVLAARKDNPVVMSEQPDPELLRAQKFVSTPEKSSMHNLTHQICYSFGFVPKFTIQSDIPEELIGYIEKGHGVGIVPAFDWASRFSEDVICKPLGDYKRNTCVFYDPRRERNRASELFLKRLLEYQN